MEKLLEELAKSRESLKKSIAEFRAENQMRRDQFRKWCQAVDLRTPRTGKGFRTLGARFDLYNDN